MRTKYYIIMEYFISAGIIMLVILTFGLLSSCSVIKTDFNNSNSKKGMAFYYLPETLLKISVKSLVLVKYDAAEKTLFDSNRLLKQTYIVTPENIADTEELLSLQYKSNALMSDDVKFEVNEFGLLETINVTTEDRTAEIITQLANAPSTVLGISEVADRSDEIIQQIKEFEQTFEVKASEIYGNSDGYPIQYDIVVPNEMGIDEIKIVKAGFKIKNNGIIPKENKSKAIEILKHGDTRTTVDGILTRPFRNTEFEFVTNKITGNEQKTKVVARIIDKYKILNTPINRTAFVKRTNELKIKGGVLVYNHINNPSSVEGFVSIPIDVAKAVVSVPAQLLQFKYDNTQAKKQLIEGQGELEASILNNEKEVLKRDAEIDKVLFQIESDKLNRENDLAKLLNQIETERLTRANDLEKLQFDLQKALDEAKKSQLETRDLLEELIKKIEEKK